MLLVLRNKEGKMDKKKYIEVTNIAEAIDELSFVVNNFKELITELENKKDVLKGLENLQSIRGEIDEFKGFLDEFKAAQDDFSFLLASTNKIVESLKKYADSFEKHYTTIADILQKQTNNINDYIINEYDALFKNIKRKLNTDINDIVNRIKELDKMLTNVYEKDYLNDVRKLKTQQKITNFLLIVLITISAYFAYNVNKKLNYIQTTSKLSPFVKTN